MPQSLPIHVERAVLAVAATVLDSPYPPVMKRALVCSDLQETYSWTDPTLNLNSIPASRGQLLLWAQPRVLIRGRTWKMFDVHELGTSLYSLWALIHQSDPLQLWPKPPSFDISDQSSASRAWLFPPRLSLCRRPPPRFARPHGRPSSTSTVGCTWPHKFSFLTLFSSELRVKKGWVWKL